MVSFTGASWMTKQRLKGITIVRTTPSLNAVTLAWGYSASLGIQYSASLGYSTKFVGSLRCTFGVSVRSTLQWSGAVLWACQIYHSQPVVRSTSISVGSMLQPQHSAQCDLIQPIAAHKQKQMARTHTSQPASTRADCIMLSPNVCRCNI